MKFKLAILLLSLLLPGCISIEPTQDASEFIGSVTDPHGVAIYGTKVEYTRDIYLGRLSRGATIRLESLTVGNSDFNIPIIKVEVLSDNGYGIAAVGKTGWVNLTSTDFVDFYNPNTKMLDPSRIETSKES